MSAAGPGATTTDDDGGGGFSVGLDDVGLGFLSGNLSVLRTFVTNPRRFVIGAVATAILEGLFDAVTALIDAVLFIFGGSKPFQFDPTESFGLADIPILIATTAADAGGNAGDAILGAIGTLNSQLFGLAETAGPAAPVITAAVIAAEIAVVAFVGARTVRVILDLVPGGGGLV